MAQKRRYTRCYRCNTRTNLHKCKYCRKYYCSEHISPSDHACLKYRILVSNKRQTERDRYSKSLTGILNHQERRKNKREDMFSTRSNISDPIDSYTPAKPKIRFRLELKRRISRLKISQRLSTLVFYYILISYLYCVGAVNDVERHVPMIHRFTDSFSKISLFPVRNETLIERQIYDMNNQVRISQGVSVLSYNDELAKLAKDHSEDMQKRFYFSHDTPEGLNPTDRAVKNGINVVKNYGFYYQTGIGENIMDMPITFIPIFIWNSDCLITINNKQISQCTIDGWKRSQGHYENMINPSYDEIGVGVYCNFWGCKLTQDFR